MMETMAGNRVPQGESVRVILKIDTDIKNEKDWLSFKNRLNEQVVKSALELKIPPPEFVAHLNFDFLNIAWNLVKRTGLPFETCAKEMKDCIINSIDMFIEGEREKQKEKN
jgi:hypothetical protein